MIESPRRQESSSGGEKKNTQTRASKGKTHGASYSLSLLRPPPALLADASPAASLSSTPYPSSSRPAYSRRRPSSCGTNGTVAGVRCPYATRVDASFEASFVTSISRSFQEEAAAAPPPQRRRRRGRPRPPWNRRRCDTLAAKRRGCREAAPWSHPRRRTWTSCGRADRCRTQSRASTC